MMLSSDLYLGLPLGLVVKGFHLNVCLAALASGIFVYSRTRYKNIHCTIICNSCVRRYTHSTLSSRQHNLHSSVACNL